MIDIDHFKQFNDRFGHDAGDFVLQTLGNFFNEHIRKGDIACRYGGEEFTLILPGASLEVVKKRAEFLRNKVKHLSVEHREHHLGAITFSIGVATFPQHGKRFEELLHAADIALYHAKKQGRDRVVTAA
jgi:diguanylate cyclase (GGDEF)-like protein